MEQFSQSKAASTGRAKPSLSPAEQRDMDWRLCLAAEHGDKVSTIRFLTKNGASVDAQNASGQSALRLAISGGHGSAARALLDLGAQIADEEENAFFGALGRGDASVARAALRSAQGERFAKIRGENRETALMMAIGSRKIELIETVLRHSDLSETDNDNETALHWALWMSTMRVAELLLPLCDAQTIERRNNEGRTPLGIMLARFGEELNAKGHWSERAEGRKRAAMFERLAATLSPEQREAERPALEDAVADMAKMAHSATWATNQESFLDLVNLVRKTLAGWDAEALGQIVEQGRAALRAPEAVSDAAPFGRKPRAPRI
jgi:hypothetical protein